jgi:hypothetical protein
MLTNFSFTGQQKYNGIATVPNCIAVIPFISVTTNNISRLNRVGFFISATDQKYTSIKQRVAVRVSDYSVISLLPNAANSATKKLKKT